MDSKILQFISSQQVCSLTTLLPDGSPHAAAVHYSYENNPLRLIFSTVDSSRKCLVLREGRPVKSAVVIWLGDEECITLQMNGIVRPILEDKELAKAQSVHYPRHPHAERFKNDPTTIFLEFVPTWWRYTDHTTDPVTILSS